VTLRRETSQRICTRCVMDTSDPDISFDGAGVCNHCQRYDQLVSQTVADAAAGRRTVDLDVIFSKIKADGKGKDYDCIMGLSGGVDSSYVAYIAKQYGLRPLAVHFDSGWNSELAVNNIENIVKKLDIDLFTFVVDWEEMRDLQLSFFKASVANCDIPTDHAFVAVLFREAAKRKISYVLSGSNFATEFILPTAWGYQSDDSVHLKDIQRRFGTLPLKAYPTMSFFERFIYYPYIRGIKVIKPLNYLPYNKFEAKQLIADKLNWRDYGGKHYESIFTRFFQAYYLPTKFGYDKRRAHLSSLIVSGQMTRDAALEELEQPPYPTQLLERDKEYIAKKLRISSTEFDEIIAQPIKDYSDYKSLDWMFKYGLRLKRLLERRI